MSNVWIAGDLHLGHKNVCRFRSRFASPENHDAFVVDLVLGKGGKRNHLLLLGDCFFTAESLNALRDFRKAYGKITIVLGNHDTDNSERKENIRTMVKDDLVDDIHASMNKYGMLWSHIPVHPDELRGKISVHAHMHDRVIDDPRYVCLSLEQTGYRMVDLNHVRKLVEDRCC